MDPELRQRWDTPEGLLLAGEVLAQLRAGRPLGGLGLGQVDGRADLRGFPAPVPHPVSPDEVARWRTGDLPPGTLAGRVGRVILDGVPLRGLDLSAAVLDHVTVRDCVVEDCLFEGARCHEAGFARSRVRDASFRGADLREASLGGWFNGMGNDYDRVDFSGADLRGVYELTAAFTDCDFSGARLDKVKFTRSGLVRCRFSGILEEVWFNGMVADPGEGEPNYAEDIDMSGAVLRSVKFRGFNLATVKLPDDPGLRVIGNYPCVLRKAVNALDHREDKPARVLLSRLRDQQRGVDRGFPLGLFNRDDYVRVGGEELAMLADQVLREAERACAGEIGLAITGAADRRSRSRLAVREQAGRQRGVTVRSNRTWPGRRLIGGFRL
jgi:uncharacterized protein YjbI with pentapeptide repeats